jgi:dolichol-phosphate mannosyltransferase
VPGIIIIISFFFGILFLNMGIFGLYLAKIFEQTKKRPRYIIDNIINKKVSSDQ